MAEQTKTDQAILGKEGSDAPLSYGDFTLYEVSIESPSNPGALLYLDSPTVFQELNIFEDLFSNVLKGTFTFLDTQGWAENLSLIHI